MVTSFRVDRVQSLITRQVHNGRIHQAQLPHVSRVRVTNVVVSVDVTLQAAADDASNRQRFHITSTNPTHQFAQFHVFQRRIGFSVIAIRYVRAVDILIVLLRHQAQIRRFNETIP